MIIYSFVFFILFYFAYIVDYKGLRGDRRPFYWIESIGLVLIITCQWRMGGDNLAYEVYYKDIPTFSQLQIDELAIGTKYQPLWYIFTSLLKSITPSYVFFHFVHSAILTIITFWFLQKYSKYELSIILIYVVSLQFFYFNLEIQRESMAIMCFLIAVKYLINKSYIKYYLICVIAFFFHISAIFLLLIPPMLIFTKRLDSPVKVLAGSIISAVIIVIAFNSILNSFIPSEELEVADRVMNQVENYSEVEVSFVHALIGGVASAVPVYLVLLIRLKKRLEFDIFTQLCIVLIIVYFCHAYVTGISRFANYLLFPFYICLVDTIAKTYRYKSYKVLVLATIGLLVALTVYNETRPVPINGVVQHHYNLFIPYRTIFD